MSIGSPWGGNLVLLTSSPESLFAMIGGTTLEDIWKVDANA